MKKAILKISSLTILAIVLFTSQVFAHSQFEQTDDKDKLVVKIHAPIIRAIVDVFDLSDTDLAILESQLEEVRAITVTYAEQELDLVFDDNVFDTFGMSEDLESRQLENWMFTDLATNEETIKLEDWMFAPDYYTEDYDNSMIEDWMLDELLESEEQIEIEEWMFAELDTDNENEELEAWMFDTEYFNK